MKDLFLGGDVVVAVAMNRRLLTRTVQAMWPDVRASEVPTESIILCRRLAKEEELGCNVLRVG